VIRREHRVERAGIDRQNEAVLVDAAAGVVDSVHALIAGCTAAVVVVGAAAEWKMLAQSGPEDLSRTWRRLVSGTGRRADPPCAQRESLVVPFASERIRALLVVVPLRGISLPSGTRRIVQPILDAGGIVLDASLSRESSPVQSAPQPFTGTC
jgi:hypothetical protein